ncbi:MAG: Asp-tRNA(Asn)/Glu-tRNA(Gln) amidotransferase subunit GatA [Planctomycetota bacterium]|nr:Asp-tRNA(Asn)/Glu-tRNA(Gln) amidotransferase subunit GatA [Planctomycetota bacterium]
MDDHAPTIELDDDLVARTARVRRGDATTRSRVEAALSRIERIDPDLNAYHETLAETALSEADEVDSTLGNGEDPGPLAGAVLAIKDNICTLEGRTTCSSRMLADYRSPFEATAVTRLKAAGAVVIGKTNLDEFAMGSSSERCAWGPVRNPHALDRVPGGSSGGSAAAVAADLADAARGRDPGGSIRQPAAFCGTVGFKPTYGRISRHGLVAFGSSLDQIGPITRSVRDAALLYETMAGLDPADSTTSDFRVEPCRPDATRDASSWRVGVPREHRDEANHPVVAAALDRAIAAFREAGAEIVDVDLPLTDHGISTYYIIAPAEASSNLSRYDGIRYGHRAEIRAGEGLEDLYARTRTEGFGEEVRRRILLGTYVLSAGYYDAYYKRALQVRRLIKREFDRAFESCDVLLGPTTPAPAFRIGADLDLVSMYLNDVYTVNSNIAGIPSMSLPTGRADVDGIALPVGVQLQTPAFAEPALLQAGAILESLL